jgi:uncharacterized protein (TIGR02594 family)
MISRRTFAIASASFPLLMSRSSLADPVSDDLAVPFDQLVYPPFEALEAPATFGYSEPDEKAKAKAADIIKTTVNGPHPIDIAQNFVDRFYKADPDAISQWPAPAAWNPLIVEFFNATSLKANNDMVSWCAAFANWCIDRAGHQGSRSASSQSFLQKEFTRTNDPKVGNVAVFTCYDKQTNESIGLGHVAFVREKPRSKQVKLIGGNTAADGHSSIICKRYFETSGRNVRRRIGGNWVECIMRLNTYVEVS